MSAIPKTARKSLQRLSLEPMSQSFSMHEYARIGARVQCHTCPSHMQTAPYRRSFSRSGLRLPLIASAALYTSPAGSSNYRRLQISGLRELQVPIEDILEGRGHQDILDSGRDRRSEDEEGNTHKQPLDDGEYFTEDSDFERGNEEEEGEDDGAHVQGDGEYVQHHQEEAEATGKTDPQSRVYATGRRKTSSARVWIKRGTGEFVVNGQELHEYFPRYSYREQIIEPFVVLGLPGLFDVWCTVKGGGTTGQAGAITLGIARALKAYNADWRKPLKDGKLLTRDPRMVEPKKTGQPKARKKDQWVKR